MPRKYGPTRNAILPSTTQDDHAWALPELGAGGRDALIGLAAPLRPHPEGIVAAPSAEECAIMQFFVGLDVALETTSICVIDERGIIIKEGKVESHPRSIARFVSLRAASRALSACAASSRAFRLATSFGNSSSDRVMPA